VYAVIDKLTVQGYDLQFGTNMLGTGFLFQLVRPLPNPDVVSFLENDIYPTSAGHFYFTKLLLPVITATAKKSPPGTVRVVNVASLGHQVAPPEGILWSMLRPGDDFLASAKKLGGLKLYGQSKLVSGKQKPNPIPLWTLAVVPHPLRYRATYSSQTNLLGDTAAMASCPSPYTRETLPRISGAMQVWP
jgi:hypothetical protein